MDAHMQGPSKYEGTDRRRTQWGRWNHETMPESSRAHHMHSSSGLARAGLFGWLVCLFVWWKSRFKENCEDSAAALSQVWSRNFIFARDLSVTTCNKRQESIFLPDFSAKIDPKIKQRFHFEHPARWWIYDPENILLTSKFSFLFHPYTYLTETETVNSWETTNNKPPGPIIMIHQLERGSTNQIRFITLFSCRCKALLRLLLASPTCVQYAQPNLFCWAKLVNLTFLHPMLLCWITYSAPLGILLEHFHRRSVCGPALEIFD
jgi:hypothetical protein